MKRKGLNYNYADHLGWRSVEKEDLNIYGKTRTDNYGVSIVYKRKCSTYEQDGKIYYNPKGIKSIPMVCTRSNAGYGKPKLRKQIKQFWFNLIGNKTMYHGVDKYYTTPEYWVENGLVYQGTFSKPHGSVAYFQSQTGCGYKEAGILRNESYFKWMRNLKYYKTCYMGKPEDYFESEYTMFESGQYEIWKDSNGIFYKSWRIEEYPYIDNLISENVTSNLSMTNLVLMKKEIGDMLQKLEWGTL